MNPFTTFGLQFWRHLFQVPLLLLLARRDLRRGRPARAKARFIRCTHLVPFSFQAHFGLACIYLGERDFSRAQRELLLAQEIAPSRFRAAKARLPEFSGATERESPAGAVPAGALSARRGTESDADDWQGTDEHGTAAGRGGSTADSVLLGVEGALDAFDPTDGFPDPPGDVSSHEEWLKFQRMGPICATESGDVDWDAVIDALQRDHG